MSFRLLVAPLALVAVPASAQQALPAADAPQQKNTIVTIGIGAAQIPDYDGASETRWTPVPGARALIDGVSFTWRGNRFWADVIPDNAGKGFDWQLGPLLNVNFNRSGKTLDARVAALGRVPEAIEGGVQAAIGYQGLLTSDFDKLTLGVGFVHDLGSVHRSYVLSPTLSYATPLSRGMFVYFSASADYAGSGYARRYFGVTRAGAVASGLPEFDAKAGWKDWSATGLVDLALTGDVTGGIQLIGAGTYTRLLGDFAASPIVHSRDQWIGAFGLAYTF